MGRKKTENSPEVSYTLPIPALTNEGREDQLICMAINLAEKQLMEGTASSQVIVHYLKLGSTRERIEKELLQKRKDLLEVQTEACKSAKRVEELYEEAIAAMKLYSGS